MTIPRFVKVAFATLLMSVFLTQPTQAATAQVQAEVRRTLTVADDEKFGGCMVVLSVSPSEEGLDCSSSWVSFSCSGTFTSKSNALRMFDSAQLAFVTGKTVIVEVDDTKKHNGHCFASRIDVLASD